MREEKGEKREKGEEGQGTKRDNSVQYIILYQH